MEEAAAMVGQSAARWSAARNLGGAASGLEPEKDDSPAVSPVKKTDCLDE